MSAVMAMIKLNLPDGVTFDFNKTDIKPFYPSLNTIAGTLREYNQTIVEVSGIPDNIGSDAVNQRISEQRANQWPGYFDGAGQRERSKSSAWQAFPDCRQRHRARAFTQPSRGNPLVADPLVSHFGGARVMATVATDLP